MVESSRKQSSLENRTAFDTRIPLILIFSLRRFHEDFKVDAIRCEGNQ